MSPTSSNDIAGLAEILRIATLQDGYNAAVVTVGTTMLGVAGGVVGVFALLRRRSLVADAMSHATLPGIAIAFLASVALGGDGRSLPVLLSGAAISGIVGVLAIQTIVRHSRIREDAAIGIVLSVFFGAGVVLLSWIQANVPSSSAGIDHFIYGRTASMLAEDALVMTVLAAICVASSLLLRKEFVLACFDPDFARSTGWPIGTIDLLLLALVVIVTVAGIQAVGIVLVVAMLVIPPVSARFWSNRLARVLLLAGVLGGIGGWAGAVISASLPRQPAGAVIVLTSGSIFLASLLWAPVRGVLPAWRRRRRLRLRVEGDHLLEAAFEANPRCDVDRSPIAHDLVAHLSRTRAWTAGFRRRVFRDLRREGRIVVSPELALTPRGHRRGATVARNHRLWERYLVTHADIAANHVDWSVDQVEHVLSADLISSLEAALAAEGVTIPPVDEESTP
ncbi:MAG: iron chelate uptake ABC transporter family permease subunit [Planctomycetota bacterium]|nr:iron chelate uptake ABC transporter family permease subunit [Planctomycetota bacterium]